MDSLLNLQSLKGRQRVLKELGFVGLSDDTEEACHILPRSLKHDFSPQQARLHNKSTLAAVATSASIFERSGISPFGLLEELFRKDPWRLVLSTIMLNRTTRCQVDVVLYKFLCKWPDAESTAVADETEIGKVIFPMGMTFRRARGIIRFSREWLALLAKKTALVEERNTTTLNLHVAFQLTKEDVLGLYNCGNYAYDAYRIFIQGDLYAVTTDHALQIYVNYYRGLEKAIRE